MSCVKLLGAPAGRPAGSQELHLSLEFCDLRIQIHRLPLEFTARRALDGQFRPQSRDLGSE